MVLGSLAIPKTLPESSSTVHGLTHKPEGGSAASRSRHALLKLGTDTRFASWQCWVTIMLAVIGVFRAFALLSGLPMFLLVLYAGLTQ